MSSYYSSKRPPLVLSAESPSNLSSADERGEDIEFDLHVDSQFAINHVSASPFDFLPVHSIPSDPSASPKSRPMQHIAILNEQDPDDSSGYSSSPTHSPASVLNSYSRSSSSNEAYSGSDADGVHNCYSKCYSNALLFSKPHHRQHNPQNTTISSKVLTEIIKPCSRREINSKSTVSDSESNSKSDSKRGRSRVPKPILAFQSHAWRQALPPKLSRTELLCSSGPVPSNLS